MNMKFYVLKLYLCLKLIFISSFFLNIPLTYANDTIVNKVNVLGERRLSESFIKKFIPDLKDGVFDNQTLNDLTKKFYMTGYFSNVKLNIINNTLEITIKELPIINNVSFSGNDILDEKQLKQIVSIAPREIFNKQITIINDEIELLEDGFDKSKLKNIMSDIYMEALNL